jgi:hypothetical protein
MVSCMAGRVFRCPAMVADGLLVITRAGHQRTPIEGRGGALPTRQATTRDLETCGAWCWTPQSFAEMWVQQDRELTRPMLPSEERYLVADPGPLTSTCDTPSHEVLPNSRAPWTFTLPRSGRRGKGKRRPTSPCPEHAGDALLTVVFDPVDARVQGSPGGDRARRARGRTRTACER